MDRFYQSIYGPFIERFVCLKRSLGYQYKGGVAQLHRFDKLATDRDESEIGIPKELAEAWSRKDPNESDPTRYIRIEIIRQFSLFLCHLGYVSYVPRLPKFNSQYTPYIFSKEQIKSLFIECDKLIPSTCSPKSSVVIIPALFRLLYGTGMRISEALSLLFNDVNIEKRCLTVRNCKNGQDRLIPLSASLVDVCKEYLQYRSRFTNPAANGSNYFFISPEGKPIDPQIAYQWFRKVLYKAGISHGGKGIGPRLHDLRHTFSVHSLAKMAQEGLDLYYCLPILSTYLGHQSLAATNKYVRLTAEMYPSIVENANKLYPYLFPELLKSESNETN